jgi:hypothetical protein
MVVMVYRHYERSASMASLRPEWANPEQAKARFAVSVLIPSGKDC